MARNRYGGDAQLAARMFLVMFLLAALYLGFIAVLVASGADFFFIVLVAGLLLFVQYYYSDRMVLWSMGAREVESSAAPELHATIERLCALADLPKPRIALVDSTVPNAFATGRSPQHAVIAVTTGLMSTLPRAELDAVLAHELSHVRHRDVAVMTMASFFAMVAQLMMRSFLWGGIYRMGGRRQNAAAVLLVYLASLVVWIVSFFLIRALSRYRELAADRGSAMITGDPAQLASALLRISGSMEQIPTQDLREVEAANALFIVPALSGDALTVLFATHPPLQKRLDNLKRIAQQMERP